MDKWDYAPKEQKSPNSFMEVARTKSGFLYDEVAILDFSYNYLGVSIRFTYTRHGQTLSDIQPVVVAAQEFAVAREGCKSKEDFAKSFVVQRLFAEGARQYNDRQVVAKEDFIKDMEFLDRIK